MGCGSSRSPARVGVFLEEDEVFYPELYPPLVNSWVGRDTTREASSSFCESSSPPPYTPLPLSGHITLLLGTESPTKTEERSPDVSRDRSASPTPDNPTSSSVQQLQLDSCTNDTQTDATAEDAVVNESNNLPTESQSSTHAIDVISTGHRDMDEQLTSSPIHQDHRNISLSSSFPSARPPSPFPRTRSLSSQLPPLRQLRHSTGEPPPPPTTTPHNAVFRLPPLALQRQHSLDSSANTTTTPPHHHHHKRRRRRVRSVSCQIQTTGLNSVQEQTIAIVQ